MHFSIHNKVLIAQRKNNKSLNVEVVKIFVQFQVTCKCIYNSNHT